MLQIAICDDEPIQLHKLERLLQEYLQARPQLTGRVTTFESGPALLAAAEACGGFDLYLMDIIMPGLDGIATARRLRAMGPGGEIIFLTNANDYAADSYSVRAFFYLLKPPDRQQLFDAFDRAAEALRRRQTEGVLVATHGGARLVLFDRILYAERFGRVVRYHCVDGTVQSTTLRTAFRDVVAPLLADRRFCLCGASFVLNMERVTGVEDQCALLDDGSRVALPRTSASAFKAAWGDFWLNRDGEL